MYNGQQEPTPMQDLEIRQATPKKQELLRYHDISIHFLSIGCVIKVGCKEIPFSSNKEALLALSKYVSNPRDEYDKWTKVFDEQE